MRRALAAGLAAAAAVVGLAATGGRAASPQPLAAFSYAGRNPVLVQVDPLTFRRVGKRELKVDGFGNGWTLSPGRPLAVLGSDRRELLFVDTRRLRRLGTMKLSAPGNVRTSAWFGERVVLLSHSDTGSHYVRTVDAVRRRLLSVRRLEGSLQATGRTPKALVLLLAPLDGIGPATLAVVPPDGPIRTVVLEQIPSGWEIDEDFEAQKVLPYATAALAVEPAGRAYVAGGGTPVAEVDLATLEVAYHPVATPPTPDATTKGAPDGPSRQAVWLGGGAFVLSGADAHGWIDAEGRGQTRTTPAGAILVDTRSWTTTTIDPSATSVALAGATLLVESSLWDSAAQVTTGRGLTAYDTAGTKRYQLFDGTTVFVQAIGSRLIVQQPRQRFRYSVVETATGRVVRTVRGADPPWALVPEA